MRLFVQPSRACNREGSTPEQTQEVFQALFIALAGRERVPCLRLVLCGPNVPRELNGTRHDCFAHVSKGKCTMINEERLFPDDGSTLAVHLAYSSSLYHHIPHQLEAPHALFLFNAGLWGYDDWRPTLDHVLFGPAARPGLSPRTAMVITSYCEEEADDDMDTIEKLVSQRRHQPGLDERGERGDIPQDVSADDGEQGSNQAADVQWLWQPELNPHRSLVVRESKCAEPGRLMFENHYWQAVQLPTYGG